MKFVSSLALIIISIFLIGCESSENSVLTPNYKVNNFDNPSNIKFDVGIDLLDIEDVFVATKEINGTEGGNISLDTVYTDSEGNLISIEVNLNIKPNSFTGNQNITIRPDPSSGSIRFSPAMTFDFPLELDIKYKGINLSRLGFDSNAKVDFVYQANDGTTQIILFDECKIDWSKQEIKVKKAELPHFSRYIFVR